MTLLNDMHTKWNAANNDNRIPITKLFTTGRGYYSTAIKAVGITELSLGYVNEDKDFGELCVHFNTDTWRPDVDGLIYSDSGFKVWLARWLITLGLAGNDVHYSEQGMQGDNYVSCDVGKEFLDSWFSQGRK